jgi:hypothetical protein
MLQSYFEKDPERWIYDFLSENAELEEVVLDFTPLIGCPAVSSTSNNTGTKSSTKRGQLLVGLCNAIKDEIFNLERESQKKKTILHFGYTLRWSTSIKYLILHWGKQLSQCPFSDYCCNALNAS